MTKQIILLAEPINEHARPLEDLRSVIKGLMRSYGYSDQDALLVNNGWHPISEKPPEAGYYLGWDGANLFEWIYSPLAQGVLPVTHWQPLPEPPETEERKEHDHE